MPAVSRDKALWFLDQVAANPDAFEWVGHPMSADFEIVRAPDGFKWPTDAEAASYAQEARARAAEQQRKQQAMQVLSSLPPAVLDQIVQAVTATQTGQ